MLHDYIRRALYERRLRRLRQVLAPSQIYQNQKSAIASIAKTAGFQEVVEFFVREKDLHEKRLKEIRKKISLGQKVDRDHLVNVMTSIQNNEVFLNWVTNLLDSPGEAIQPAVDQIGEVTD